MPSTQASDPSTGARYCTASPSCIMEIGGPSQVWPTSTPSFSRPFFCVSASFQKSFTCALFPMQKSVTFCQVARIVFSSS